MSVIESSPSPSQKSPSRPVSKKSSAALKIEKVVPPSEHNENVNSDYLIKKPESLPDVNFSTFN